MPKSAIIHVMSEAAVKASKGLLRDFGEVDRLQVSRKGASGFVTQSDIRAEKILYEELNKARPDYGFLMEERGEVPGKDKAHRFIVDPLDGTSNFIHALPYFCISIALEKTHGDGSREIVAAVIYDPIHNEMFTAEKGQGAFLGERKLTVSSRREMEIAMFSTGAPRLGKPAAEPMLATLDALKKIGTSVRFCGAAALDLAYVAAGRYDGFWHEHLQPWDIAAGVLMVREAGGKVTDLSGGATMMESGHILAASASLHFQLHSLLAPARGETPPVASHVSEKPTIRLPKT